MEHFSLLCLTLDAQRQDLLTGNALLQPFVQVVNLSNDALTQLLLYDGQDLSNYLNRSIIKLTFTFYPQNWSV